MNIDELSKEIHKNAIEHGFWDCMFCNGAGTINEINGVPIPPIECIVCNGTDIYRNDGECIALMHCYSDDTDILTENGWVSLKYLVNNKKQYKVATLNIKSGFVEYQNIIKFHKYKYNGKMVNIGGKYRCTDILVTPNHNILNSPMKSNNWRLTEANKLSKNVKLRRDFNYINNLPDVEWFYLPSIEKYKNNNTCYNIGIKKIKMNDWLGFFGIWIAEGSAFCNKNKKNYTVNIKQTKQNGKVFIRKILKKCGFKFYEQPTGDFIISNKQLYMYLSQFGHSWQKYIPIELKKLNKRQLGILINAMILGDGHIYRKSYKDYNTNSLYLRDDVQEIALKLGYCSSYTICKKEKKLNVYKVSFSVNKKYPRQNNGCNSYKLIDYDGFVYCVSVDNKTVMVRRNGKTCWCGNSELSEALEELRKNYQAREISTFKEIMPNNAYYMGGENGIKPEGWLVELADCVIRILDFVRSKDINNFEEIILKKMEYNRERPYKHNKKF
jgi:hypothetical protein